MGAIRPKSGSCFPDFEQWHIAGSECAGDPCGKQQVIVHAADSQDTARASSAKGIASSARMTTTICTRRTD